MWYFRKWRAHTTKIRFAGIIFFMQRVFWSYICAYPISLVLLLSTIFQILIGVFSIDTTISIQHPVINFILYNETHLRVMLSVDCFKSSSKFKCLCVILFWWKHIWLTFYLSYQIFSYNVEYIVYFFHFTRPLV